VTRSSRSIARCSLLLATIAAPISTQASRVQEVDRARNAFETGRYEEAATALDSVVAAEPSNDQALYWLGRARFELRDYSRAADALKRAAERVSGNSEYHRWLGRAIGEQADRERSFSLARQVRKEFEEAVRLAPSSIPARRDLLEFYVEAPWVLGGGAEKAWSQAEAISAIDPAAGHLARAVCFAHRKDADNQAKASAEYAAALRAAPAQIGAYLEAAEYYEKRKDPAGLREAVAGAARADSNGPELAYFRGILDVMTGVTGDGGEAERLLKTYLRSVPPRSDRPSHAAAHEWLGRLYESTGRPGQAADEYREALRLDPKREGARSRLQRLGQ
jgi:tetratricopeptide (TPR) repeat protein